MTTRPRQLLAWLWLLAVAMVALHEIRFWRHPDIDTDVMALLPVDADRSLADRAMRALADAGSRRVVVAVGAPEAALSLQAARALREALPASLGWQALRPDAQLAERLVEFYRPWRQGLLTPAQRELLRTTPVERLAGDALAALYRPGTAAALTSWDEDPLGLWPDWWASRAGETLAQPRDGELVVDGEGLHWVILLFDSGRPAFALNGSASIHPALEAGRQAAARIAPGCRVLTAGIPLHAEAAAVSANREINVIGWGSAVAVFLLVWLAFRRASALGLIALSLIVGTVTAISVTVSVFGSIHLIALVFGSTLIGVAEDFGIHYLASRQAQPGTAPAALLRELLPALGLALATSVLGYLVLGVAPFPGLRQIALFSSVGLVSAYLTVACWFPVMDRSPPLRTGFATALGASIEHMPRLRARGPHAIIAACLAAAVIAGLLRLQTDDSLRQLQSSPAALVADQRELGSLLGLPSASQFFLVTGGSPEAVLQREEALTDRLAVFAAQGTLQGYRALSDWLPSASRQARDAALTLPREAAVIRHVNTTLGETMRPPPAAPAPLSLAHWLADADASAGARDLWLGRIDGGGAPALFGSVVIPRGLQDGRSLPQIASTAAGLPGVQWVDKAADMAGLLRSYRISMSWLLAAGHVLIFGLLWLRYRGRAWRAYAPTALATAVALATLGLIGIPLQLFNVLALLLLLGVGVDYGIFIQEHDGDRTAWLAVVLGAASTLLSFGLLGLSATPALRAFGITLGAGLLAVALLSPMLRRALHHIPRREVA